MNLQFLADGFIAGATIGLGAVGVTLTYSILRFSNFAHGEYVSWGAYLALSLAGLLAGWLPSWADAIEPLSIGLNFILASLIALVLTGLMAWLIDRLLFAKLRQHGSTITLVMASFGASMALRALLEVIYSTRPAYYSHELQIAMDLGYGVRVTADQLLLLAVTAILVLAIYLLLVHTSMGRQMRAVSENPTLARIMGVDVDNVVRVTWWIGGALAAASGVLIGLVVQIRPGMGADLLLPLFAAAILGGIGSVPGALLGGLLVGLTEAVAVPVAGAQWRAGVSFAVLMAVLLLRPTGLFGARR